MDEVEKEDSNDDHDNENEEQLYPQFTGLQYEALAAKKRKALANTNQEGPMKKANTNNISGASVDYDAIMAALNYSVSKKSRKPKVRGRQKGSKNKLSPDITKMLGDATLHYAHGHYEEAISVLLEVIRLAPVLPDSFHTLGLVYHALGNTERVVASYWFAAHLRLKDTSLWKLLFTWFIEQRDTDRAMYCLSKAISADPNDITIRFHRASLYVELGDFQRAAESYEEILQLCPENVEALKNGAKEALYNIAPAYHHDGLVYLAASYYEKALATREKDYPSQNFPMRIQTLWKIGNQFTATFAERQLTICI